MTTCIVGAGATGLLLLLLLQDANADLSKVTIVDPHFDGGDLAHNWTAVISNTPWSKTVNALKRAFPSLVIPDTFDLGSLTPLIEIANLLRTLAAPALAKVTQIQGRVLNSNYDTSTAEWSTVVDSGSVKQIVKTTKLILAHGSEPKSMSLSIPTIPLQTALDVTRLKYYIKTGDKVLVFGTMHSGTLAIQNLASLGANVFAYYKHDKPFYWDRDNVYDGIKAEAAEIADRIVSGTIPVSLVSTKDIEQVVRTSRDAKWAVYATGFAPRQIHITVDGIQKTTEYDGLTGRLINAPAWGFGIAYPNRAPDGIHWDVSVAAFLEHMKSQLPAMNS